MSGAHWLEPTHVLADANTCFACHSVQFVCMQIFLTANPKLRSEVAKQFNKLRAAILHDLTESKRLEELSKQDYPSLADIPSDAFPLFWTTKQYLRAVDATLPATPLRDGPFFPRCVEWY